MGKIITKNPTEAARQAAELILKIADDAIAKRGRFAISLTGGSTAGILYPVLSASPGVDWKNWYFFFGDERFVAPDDKDSNLKLAKETLLDNIPVPPENIFPMPTEKTSAKEVAQAYELTIRGFFDDKVNFNLMLLGLGPDGHVASLFPGMPSLEEKEKLVVATPHGQPAPHVERITLTLPVINASLNTLLFVIGENKTEIVSQIFRGNHPKLPASKLSGHITWILDEAAASKL